VTTPSKLFTGLGFAPRTDPRVKRFVLRKVKRFVTTIPHSSYEERKPLYVPGRTSAPQPSAACKKKGPNCIYWHILGGGVEPVCITLYRQNDLL
jgi:hypothetical protein